MDDNKLSNLINPYSIQPNEEWEIQNIEIKLDALRGQPCELFLYLVNRLMANFYGKVELLIKYQSSVDYDLVLYENLTSEFNHREIYLYFDVRELIYKELKMVIDIIIDVYSVNDIKATQIKDSDSFLSISPFFYPLSDWRYLMMNVQVNEYENNRNEFAKKLNFLINSSLSKTKLKEFWNFRDEYAYLINQVDFEYFEMNEGNIDLIKNIEIYRQKEIESFEIILRNNYARTYNRLEDYKSVLRSLNLKIELKKSPTHLFNFLKDLLDVNEDEELRQVRKFIDNFFKWDVKKYGEIHSKGDSISFLNREKVKKLVGFLWYMVKNTKLTTFLRPMKKNIFEELVIKELGNLNDENIGLSKGNLCKNIDKYRENFNLDYPFSKKTKYELFR